MKRPSALYIDNKLVDNAVSHWRKGALVAFPTETVYGLGADAENGEAVARIYSVKSRPQFNPLIVHVADVKTAKRYAEWNPLADKLVAAFWPGPLTIVLQRREECVLSDLVSAGGNTVGIRIPSHPMALRLLRDFGKGVAAPSANRSGKISPTTAAHVREELGDSVPLIIDGGPCDVGLESTVVDLSESKPVLLRTGRITRAMIEQKLGQPLASLLKRDFLRSPGQLESHYAPNLPVRLNAASVSKNEALLAFGPNVLQGAAATYNLSVTANILEAASHLFAGMRALDDTRYDGIAVMPITMEGVGEAINDRLRRAAVR